MKILVVFAILLSQCTAQFGPTVLPQTAIVSRPPDSSGGGFPQPCLQVLAKGGDSPYPPTSVARIYSMFCPVINEFATCLELHLNESSVEYFVLLSKHFDKNLMVSRMQHLCSLIPSDATSLDTLKTNNSDVQACVANFNREMARPSQPLTLNILCRLLDEHVFCMRQYATPDVIPENVLEVYFAYTLIFTPGQCNPPIPSTFMPTINTPPAVSNDPGQTWLAQSVVARCAYETYGEVIKNIMAIYKTHTNQLKTVGQVLGQAMGSLCQNATRFSDCISQNVKQPYSSIDAGLSVIINLQNLGSSLIQICSTSMTQSELMCLFQSGSSMPVCGSLISASTKLLQRSRSSTTPTNSINQLLSYCPLLREGDTCARIQLQRCSPALAETFSAVEKQLLTTNCYYADASVINASPYSNRMAYCAAPVMAEAYQRFANRPWAFDDEHVTSFACKESSNLATCLSREVGISKNLVDKMTSKLIDFSSGPRLQYIFDTVCNNTEEILRQSRCMVNATNSFRVCKMEQSYKDLQARYIFNFVFNISGIDVNGVTAFCKPYKELALCNARQISTCSESLSRLAEDVVNELLRMDCGGSRPLTQYMNFNAASDHKTVKVTLLLCIMLLLNVIM